MKRAFVLLVVLCSSLGLTADCVPQRPNEKAKTQTILSLTRTDSGRRFSVHVGQTIQIDLQTIGTSGYGLPQISAPLITYENSVLLWPPNPGGPLPIYMFRAVSPGEAQIRFQSDRNPDLEFILKVRPASSKPATSDSPDQVNTVGWDQAWTNLTNPVRQEFVPSLPKLTSVEVELVIANPGTADQPVQMMLLDSSGRRLLAAERTVSADVCEHVSFLLPAGFEVQPGRVYGIELSDDGSNVFGWKYVMGGYKKGDAWFAGKPLVEGGRATFLFRTFGMK